MDNDTTRNLSVAEGEDLGEPRSGLPLFVADEDGVHVSNYHACAAMAFFPFPSHVALWVTKRDHPFLSSTTHVDLWKKDPNKVSTG